MMFPPRWFLPYDILFQLLTALVALGIGLFAFRGYRWVRERTLYFIFLAFMLLSVALFVNALALGYSLASRLSLARQVTPFSVLDIGYWIYYLLSVLAYSILVYAYARKIRDMSMAAAAALAGGSILVAGPIFEMIIVVLLFVILIAQLPHLMVKRSVNAVVVFLSFLLLVVSHILILFSQVEDVIYVVGKLLQLGGFATLLALLYNLREPK